MSESEKQPAGQDPLAFVAGGGEMGERIRAFDWSQTPLGPAEAWSPALRMMVRMMLANRLPMLLWWGPQYISIYNDPYRPVLGNKHPWGLGQPVSECWKEIWPVLQPLIDTPYHGGPATWDEDILLVINRHGFAEETHWLIAYSPVPDEGVPGGIGGVLATVHEVTEKVVGERRMVALRDLGTRPAEAKTAEAACAVAARTLGTHAKDVPFALLYLTDADGRYARLAGAAGVTPGEAFSPQVLDLEAADTGGWPLSLTRQSGQAQVVTDLASRFASVPPGPWPNPPNTAVVLPIASNKPHDLAGFFVAGVSSRLRLDDAYRRFLDLAATQVATAVATARAYEEEKRRAEALAELDRAKTAFFSNVSHEFRTPLTLMLGPVGDLLARSHTDLPPAAAGQLEVVNRNGLRLLRLVNTLLDFSRIEAGRVRAVYQPTDLAGFTAELTSVFRSACDKAGLRLAVDCPKLTKSVFVDREMWEKVVLNLLSNAFKFTFAGEIAVSLRQAGNAAELRVRDTGTGIPAEEMSRLYERFHRVENALGRTHEGSGIGLALVQELVKLHGGSVRAESVFGTGTTFIVTIPLGSAHLPADQIGEGRTAASTGTGATPYVEEALRWLPEEAQDEDRRELPTNLEDLPTPHHHPESDESDDRPRVLVADDNADMRQYVVRLLAEQFRVEAVPDGQAALAAARDRPPDLILTDVMMPKLNGFGLVKELRADPRTSGLPVIMLSARAGEESRVEGMEAGADDYLVKPFSARELLARVSAHLQMARLRREATQTLRESEERFRALVSATADVVYRMSPDWTEMRHLQGQEFIADTHEPSRSWLEKYIHPDDQRHVMAVIQEAVRTKSVFQLEHRVLRVDGTLGWTFSRAVPLLDAKGEIVEWFGAASDVTGRKQADERLRESEERLADALSAAEMGTWRADLQTFTGVRDAKLNQILGLEAKVTVLPVDDYFARVHPEDRPLMVEAFHRAIRERGTYEVEARILRPDGTERWVREKGRPGGGDGNGPAFMTGVTVDITDRKRAEEELQRERNRLRVTLASIGDAVITTDIEGNVAFLNGVAESLTGWANTDAVGQPLDAVFKIVNEATRQPVENPATRALREGVVVGLANHTVLIRKDGTERPIDDSAAPVRDGEGHVVGCVLVFRDVTERRRLEKQAIEQAEAARKLAAIVESSEDAIISKTLDGIIQSWNAAAERIFGYAANEAVGRPITMLFPADRLDEEERIIARIRSGERVEHFDTVRLRKDGTAIPISLTISPIKDSEEQIIGASKIARDITERKRLEDELRQVAAELSDADRKKDEFLATLAHELRNPLAPLRNALQIIRLSPDRDAREQARGMMERQLGQMVRLVDDLMDVSRITRGKVDLKKERVQLSAVVGSAMETSRPLIEQMGHELTVRLTKHSVVVDADPTRLAQVFANLLNNAAKYSDRGGHIWLTAERQGSDVVVSVKDTGIGIPPDKLTTIFDMFSQVDRSLEKAQGGLGIGLTLVRRLVEMHDGRVDVRSEGIGRGSEFVVRLPVVVEASVPQRDHDERAAPKTLLRILIVDDNRDGADSLAMMLKIMGNDTRTAYDGQEGVRVADEFRPDVILLDIGLPKLNGYEACRRIRERPWGKGVMLIAVTGWGQDEDRRRSEEAGFDHHMVKPVDPNALMKLLSGLSEAARK